MASIDNTMWYLVGISIFSISLMCLCSCEFGVQPADTTPCEYESTPPSGKFIYFDRRNQYAAQLKIMEDGKERELRRSIQPGKVLWSPDGSKFCYQERSASTRGDSLIIYSSEGKYLSSPVLQSYNNSCVDFAWSPDGKSIAYLKVDSRHDTVITWDSGSGYMEGYNYVYSLRVVDLDGTHERILYTASKGPYGAGLDWSCEDSTFIIAQEPQISYPINYGIDLILLDNNGSIIGQIDNRPDSRQFKGLRWSPDGSKILVQYKSDYYALSSDDPSYWIDRFSSDSISLNYKVKFCVWSPDGEYIAGVKYIQPCPGISGNAYPTLAIMDEFGSLSDYIVYHFGEVYPFDWY